jgi:MIP family channel proteins
MLRKLIAEFSGTFLLVLFGCGAMVISEISPELSDNFSIAVAFGAVVFMCIQIFGDVSGSHINPAVTLAFWIKGEINSKETSAYILAQFLGAVAAAFALKAAFPEAELLGTTQPKAGILNTWIIEFIMTFVLVITVLKICHESTLKVALTIGVLIFLEAFIGGPLTNASMNPARSFGPMLAHGDLSHFWLYASSTSSAGALAALIFKKSQRKEMG